MGKLVLGVLNEFKFTLILVFDTGFLTRFIFYNYIILRIPVFSIYFTTFLLFIYVKSF